MQQRSADFRERRRHPLEHFGGRGDRIRGDEANTAAHCAKSRRFVAAQQPPRRRIGPRCGEARPAGNSCRCLDAGAERRKVRLQRGIGALPRRAHRVVQRIARQARKRARKPEREHVDPASGNRLDRLLERQRDVARAGGPEHVRRFTRIGVPDHHARRAERDFVGEAIDVLPVDGDQQVERVRERRDRRLR